ncbi:MAG: hypothetical protein HY247_02235 [archaeon]|nr:MAG: hypothetical protein HY247_02235 [archaeon]
MDPDLELVRSLRKVLEMAASGRGIGASVVAELGRSRRGEAAAREVLLGHPYQGALWGVLGGGHEVSTMLSLISTAEVSSVPLVAESAKGLAATVERWLKAKENARLESRVMVFRSAIASGVIGAVTAMIASLGPVVSSLDLHGQASRPDPASILLGAFALATIGSAFLGAFVSGKKFIVSVCITTVTFASVALLAAPISTVAPTIPWAVK